MRRASRYRSRGGFAALVAVLLLAAVACGGGEDPQPPTPDDVDAVAAAVGDLVFQCRTYTAGHVAEPDTEALERDVATLLETSDRVDQDAAFELGEAVGLPRSTTVREELLFAARTLEDGCVPELAGELRDAAD